MTYILITTLIVIIYIIISTYGYKNSRRQNKMKLKKAFIKRENICKRFQLQIMNAKANQASDAKIKMMENELSVERSILESDIQLLRSELNISDDDYIKVKNSVEKA